MRVGFESMRVGFESRSRRAATCDMPTRAVAPREAPPRSHVVPHTLVTFTLSLSHSARVPLRRAGADARHARSGPRAIDKLLSLSLSLLVCDAQRFVVGHASIVVGHASSASRVTYLIVESHNRNPQQ